MAIQIQIRRDSAADWTSENPTLANGEMGYETDTGRLKFGDGTTAWTSLAYFAAGAVMGYHVTDVTGDITITSSNADTYLNGTTFAILQLENTTGTIDITVEEGAFADNTFLRIKHFDTTISNTLPWRLTVQGSERVEHIESGSLENDVAGLMDDGYTWRKEGTDWYLDSSHRHGAITGLRIEEEGTALTTLATALNFVGDGVTATGTGTEKTITVTGGTGEQNVQSDWNETDNTSDAYIQNKPDLTSNIHWLAPVEDRNLSAPPSSPTTGDRYIIAANPTGAWASNVNDIAEWNGSSWDFTDAVEGITTFIKDENIHVTFNGTSWVEIDSAIDNYVSGSSITRSATSVNLDLTRTGGLSNVLSTLLAATTSQAGVMTAADKTKLDGIEAGAEVNAIESIVAGTNVTVDVTDPENPVINVSSGTATDEDAIHDNVAGEINAITEKTTPVDADIIIIEDSADSNNKKKVQVGNLPDDDNYVDNFSRSHTTNTVSLNLGRTGTLPTITNVVPAATTSAAGVMSATDKTKLDGIDTGAEVNVQADWNETDNTSDAYIQNKPDLATNIHWLAPVEDRNLNTPPSSPTTGDRYIIAANPTGAWASNVNDIAEWNGSSWDFTVVVEGNTTFVKDENLHVTFDGTNWIEIDSDIDNYVNGTELARTSTTVTLDLRRTGSLADIPTLFASATQSVAGILTAADKTKLDGIEAGAEVNAIESIVAGTNVTVDVTDPENPVINVSSGTATDEDAIHDNVAGEISAITEKTTPVDADLVIIEDSADSNNKKRVQVGNLPGTATDDDAIHDNVAGEINAITEKTTPVDADLVVIEDSEDSNNKKKVQVGNLPGGDDVLGDMLPEITINSNIDLRVEANYNMYKNHRIIVTQNEVREVRLPELSPDRESFAVHGDLFAFEHRTTVNPSVGGVRTILATGLGSEGYSDGVRNASGWRLMNADATYDADATPPVAGNYVLMQVPASGGTWNILSVDADASERAMSSAGHWDMTEDGTIESVDPVEGLRRYGVLYFSESGSDDYDGKGVDRPIATLSQLNTASASLTYEAGALHKCDDDSFYSGSYDGVANFDLYAPEASFRGLRPVANSRIVAKTILTSAQWIVLPENVDIQLQRIENGTTGAQIQWTGVTHTNTRVIIESADFATTPMTFASGFAGNVHIEIYHSDLTEDPFNDVRTDVNLTGFIRLANGTFLHYGSQHSDFYVRSLDEDVTADFKRPTLLFRCESNGRTLSLPNSTSSPKDRSMYRFHVVNRPFTSTTGNDLTVTINGSETFDQGIDNIVLKPFQSGTFELWDVPEGSVWKYTGSNSYFVNLVDVGAQDTPPLAEYHDMRFSTIGADNFVPDNLVEIDSDNYLQFNADCYVRILGVAAESEWFNSTEFQFEKVKAGAATSTSNVDEVFTFASAFTQGSDSDIHVVTTATQLNREEVLPVVATTLTGFTINRSGDIVGNVPFHYVAVNSSTDSHDSDYFTGGLDIYKNTTKISEWRISPTPRIQGHNNSVMACTDGAATMHFKNGDVLKVKNEYIDGVAVDALNVNLEIILR